MRIQVCRWEGRWKT